MLLGFTDVREVSCELRWSVASRSLACQASSQRWYLSPITVRGKYTYTRRMTYYYYFFLQKYDDQKRLQWVINVLTYGVMLGL
jgi:hypothetical protein